MQDDLNGDGSDRTRGWEGIIGRRRFVYPALGFCTLLAILLRGYAYGKEDQNLYLPFILHWNDPALFPHDHLLALGFARESIVWGALALASRWIPLPVLLAALWTTASYLVLLVTYKIGLAWWGRAEAAWVAVFLWIPTYRVPGVANNTFDQYLTTRILGTLLGLTALYFFFRGRSGRSCAAIALGSLLHVISVLPLAAAMGLAHLRRHRWRALALLTGACAGAAAALMAYSAHFGASHALFAVYTGEWLNEVRRADFELFPQQWPRNAWIGLGSYLFSYYLLFFDRLRRGVLTAPEREAFTVNAGIVLGSIVGLAGALSGAALLIQMCLFRGYLFFMFLLAVALAGPLSELLSSGHWARVAVGCWVAMAWGTGDWLVQTAAVLILIAEPALLRVQRVWDWLTGRRERFLGGLLAALLAVIAWQGSRILFSWSLATWKPEWRALAGPLLATLILLGARAISPNAWRRLTAALLPVALFALLVISPTRFMVAHLGRYSWFRHLNGTSVYTTKRELDVANQEASRRAALSRLVRTLVPADATVIIPPDWMTFRLDTLRSPFVTFKDGAPVEFDEAYGRLWTRRIQEIHAMRRADGQWRKDSSLPLSRTEVLALAARYRDIHLDYIVTKAAYDLPALGRSDGWVLYRIPEQLSSEGAR